MVLYVVLQYLQFAVLQYRVHVYRSTGIAIAASMLLHEIVPLLPPSFLIAKQHCQGIKYTCILAAQCQCQPMPCQACNNNLWYSIPATKPVLVHVYTCTRVLELTCTGTGMAMLTIIIFILQIMSTPGMPPKVGDMYFNVYVHVYDSRFESMVYNTC